MLPKAAVLPLACSIMLGACATTGEDAKPLTLAQATLADGAGVAMGTVQLEQSGTDIVLVAQARGMSPGEHGIHLHAVGKCEGPGFTSAGGHLNPASHQHGSMNPAGPHLGDLPNLPAGADGTGAVRATLTGPAAALLANLFDADGTAVVIHAGPDDYKTDPSGNSGGRIGCGVLTRAD